MVPHCFLALAGALTLRGAFVVQDRKYYVDCQTGSDTNSGTSSSPFLTMIHARNAIRSARAVDSNVTSATPYTVLIKSGVCEMRTPLQLTSEDSNVQWQAMEGENVLVSGGLQIPDASLGEGASSGIKTFDLKILHLLANDTGVLRGRGYSGGSACILLNNFEPSAMELFYRLPPTTTAATRMVLARYPNLSSSVSTKDWTQVASVKAAPTPQVNTIGVAAAVAARAKAGNWKAQHAERGDIWTHGLWTYNWADSHRQVTAVGDSAASLLNVHDDDINSDVAIKKGGNFYIYNVESELDAV